MKSIEIYIYMFLPTYILKHSLIAPWANGFPSNLRTQSSTTQAWVKGLYLKKCAVKLPGSFPMVYLCLLPLWVFILSRLNFSQGSPRSLISFTAFSHLRFPGESIFTLFFFFFVRAATATEKNLPPSVGSKLWHSSLKKKLFFMYLKAKTNWQDTHKKHMNQWIPV